MPEPQASFTLGRKWYVCETRPKCEFRVEDGLKERGFDAYTPRSRHFRRSAFAVLRKQKIESPLFPGYCFVAFDIEREEWWEPIHSTDGVRCVISNNLIPCRVHDIAIERLRRAENAGAFDKTIPAATFEEGQDVEIMEGPLAGLIAKVKSAKAKKRIQLLMNGLMVEIEAHNLAKVS